MDENPYEPSKALHEPVLRGIRGIRLNVGHVLVLSLPVFLSNAA